MLIIITKNMNAFAAYVEVPPPPPVAVPNSLERNYMI